MSSVDNRIVEMQFDNKQFEQGIQTSMTSLDSLKKSLELKNSTKGLENLDKASRQISFASVANGVEMISSKFTALGVFGVTAMTRISNAAITTGKRILEELTVKPVKMGLAEYETQINAIQTILSNTKSKGTTMDQVNSALDELNYYADKTIYNFTQMTNNIGKFTAAGVDLDKSVAAIKGISNLAAVSGSTSQQASTAMYQLSQALASGTVKLMDWNSVVNAGMGGQVFQDSLKETARVHGISIDNMIKKQGSFRETLSTGWLTSEILLETLQKYTGDLNEEQLLAQGYTKAQAKAIIDLGKDANDAATKVKTFTQLIETLKEALQSGWTQSWEYIIGNFEEARDLWTKVSDAIGAEIQKSADARNDLLKGWREGGGREDLLTGLQYSFEALWNVVRTIKMAFREIIPETTSKDLINASKAVKKFGVDLLSTFNIIEWTKNKQLTSEELEARVKVAFKLEDPERALKKGLKGDDVKKLQEKLKKEGFEVGEIDGIFGKKTEAALKKYQKAKGIIADGIFGGDTYKSLFGESVGDKIQSITEKVIDLQGVLPKLKSIFAGAFAGLHIGWQGLEFLGNAALTVLDAFSPLGDMLLTIGAALGDWLVGVDKSISESGVLTEGIENLSAALEPVKTFFEGVSDAVLDFFGLGDEAEESEGKVSKFTQVWNDFTKAVEPVINWIKGAWKSVSDFFTVKDELDPTGKKVTSFTKAWNDFTKAVEPVTNWINGAWESVKQFFGIGDKAEESEGKVSNFTKVWNWFVGCLKIASGWIASIWKPIKDFFGIGDKDVESGTKLSKYAEGWEKVKTRMAPVIDWLKGAWEKIKEIFGLIGTAIGDFFSGKSFGESFGKVGDWLNTAWGDISGAFDGMFNTIGNLFNKYGTDGIIGIVGSIIGRRSLWKFGSMLRSLSGVFKQLKKTLSSYSDYLGRKDKKGLDGFANALLKMAAAIGIVIAAIYILGTMDSEILKKGAIWVGGIFAALTLFGMLSAVFLKNGASASVEAAGNMIWNLAKGIALIAAAIWFLGSMSDDKLKKGGLAVGAILVALALFAKFINNTDIKASVQLNGLIKMALAIGILALIVNMLGGMDGDKLKQGLIAVGSLMLGLVLLTAILSKVGKDLSVSSVMGVTLGFTALILAFAYAIDLIKGVDPNVMLSFASSFAIAIAALVAAFSYINKAGGGIRGMINGAGGLALGIGTIIASIVGIFTALGAIETGTNGGFGRNIKSGADILRSVGEAISSLSNEFKALMATLAMLSGIAGGKGSLRMFLGSIGIGATIASLTAFSVGILEALGALDKGSDGGFISNIERGGEILSKVSNAINGISVKFGLILVSLGFLSLIIGGKGSLDMFLGSFGIGATVASLIAFSTGILAALGSIDEGSGGKFGENITKGGEILGRVSSAIDGLSNKFLGIEGVLTTLSGVVGGKGSLDTFLGSFGIGATVTNLIGFSVMVLTALGKLESGSGGEFSTNLERGGEILQTVSNQIDKLSERFQAVLATLGGLSVIVGIKSGLRILGASFSVSGALAVITYTMTLIFAALGKFDEWTNGEFNSSIERGGKVLLTVSNAVKKLSIKFKLVTMSLTNLSRKVGKMEKGAMLRGSLEVAGSLLILSVGIGLILFGLGFINKISEGEFVKNLNDGLKIMNTVSNSVGKLNEKMLAVIGTFEALSLGSGMAGKWKMLRGSVEVGISLMVIATSIGLILLGLSFLDKTSEGEFSKSINHGLDILTVVSEKIGGFTPEFDAAIGALMGLSGIVGFGNYINITKGAVEVGTALFVISGACTLLLTGLSMLDDISDGKLKTALEHGSEIFSIIGGALGDFNEESNNMLEKLLILAGVVGAIQGHSTTIGSLKVGGSLGILTGALSGITALIGAIDEGTGGELSKLLVSGGDTLRKLGKSLGSLAAGFMEAFNADETPAERADYMGNFLVEIDNVIKAAGANVTQLQTNTEKLTGIIISIANLFAALTGENYKLDSGFINSLLGQIRDLGLSVSTFAPDISEENLNRFVSVVTAVKDFTDAMRNVTAGIAPDAVKKTGELIGEASKEWSSALSNGFTKGEVDTTNLTSMCDSIVRTAGSYQGDFVTVGTSFTNALAIGIGNSAAVERVKNAAVKAVQDAITAAKNAASSGGGSDGGDSGGGETKGLKRVKGFVSKISSILESGIDADPVIRPVVDLSDVANGAREIHNMFSGRATIPIGTEQSGRLAKSIYADRQNAKTAQNGGKNVNYDNSNSGNVNVNVDNLNVRSEDDVRAIGLEIAKQNKRLQFGYGG